MPHPSVATFLELAVGAYRLGLRTDCVVGVRQDLPPERHIQFRREKIPLLDLRVQLGDPTRGPIPFGVCFEANGERAVVGVDAVNHLRAEGIRGLKSLPRFGLRRPELFEGVLRDRAGLLLVLAPPNLLALTTGN